MADVLIDETGSNLHLGDMKECPHCGHKEIKIEWLLIADIGEEPERRKFVYCIECGHYGDLDTWNNRP